MLQALAELSDRMPASADSARIDPRIRRMVDDVLMQSPVARALGIGLDAMAVDHVELTLSYHAGNVTHGNTIHGGVIATLIDVAGAAAAASGADADTLRGGATSSLTIQYLAPAQAAPLRAVAVVVRRGRRQVVSDVSVYAEGKDEGVLVAKALMSSAMF